MYMCVRILLIVAYISIQLHVSGPDYKDGHKCLCASASTAPTTVLTTQDSCSSVYKN